MIEAPALVGRHDELLDGIGVVVELGDRRSLLECEEVVPFGGRLGEVGSNLGEGCVNRAALILVRLAICAADIPNALSCSTTPSCSLLVSGAR
jgi:hypothetical protein